MASSWRQDNVDRVQEAPFDGDRAWSVERTLRDGSVVTIRGLWPEDRDEVRRGFGALSPESRYLRFLQHAAGELSEELLTYLTSVDQKNHVALCATTASPDLKSERGIGVARFIRLPEAPDTAEAAVTVVDDMQRKGVATVLLRELMRCAEHGGIKTIRAEVLADNETMRTMLERAGATRVEMRSGGGTIAYDLRIAPPSANVFDILRAAAETMAIRMRRPFE
jgi:RimJ/RimL family protein N-acetyltransferase